MHFFLLDPLFSRKLLTGYVDESEAQKRWKLPKLVQYKISTFN